MTARKPRTKITISVVTTAEGLGKEGKGGVIASTILAPVMSDLMTGETDPMGQ